MLVNNLGWLRYEEDSPLFFTIWNHCLNASTLCCTFLKLCCKFSMWGQSVCYIMIHSVPLGPSACLLPFHNLPCWLLCCCVLWGQWTMFGYLVQNIHHFVICWIMALLTTRVRRLVVWSCTAGRHNFAGKESEKIPSNVGLCHVCAHE